MASKLKLTELLYPTSTTAAITINSDDSVTIPTQSTTNLAYTGTLTGGTGVVNIGSGQVYKDASGNVGIGTSSPTGKLHVNGGTFDSFTISGNSANSVGARFQNSAASSRNWNIGSSGGGPSPAGTFFIYDDTGSATRMTIDSSGNVGIGTTSPSYRLSSKQSGNTGAASLGVVSINSANDTFVGIGYDSASDTNRVFASYISTGAFKPISFWTSDLQRMQIDTSGNLLVGTVTSGSSRFVVSGNGSSNRVAKILGNTAGDVGTAGMLISKFDNNNSTSQVFLQFSINNDTIANGQINGNGANAAAFGTWSDARLKQNIVDLPSQLANICALRPVNFDYIESEGGGHQTGFVAQEIHNIYPDAVGKRSDGMLTVTGWSKTEARLVKAIQEQQALITNLTTRLTALEGN